MDVQVSMAQVLPAPLLQPVTAGRTRRGVVYSQNRVYDWQLPRAGVGVGADKENEGMNANGYRVSFVVV